MILADEPTAALDSENGKAVMALLAEVAKEPSRAVLAVTHDHRTLAYADRIIRIEDGRIVGEEDRQVRTRSADEPPLGPTHRAAGRAGRAGDGLPAREPAQSPQPAPQAEEERRPVAVTDELGKRRKSMNRTTKWWLFVGLITLAVAAFGVAQSFKLGLFAAFFGDSATATTATAQPKSQPAVTTPATTATATAPTNPATAQRPATKWIAAAPGRIERGQARSGLRRRSPAASSRCVSPLAMPPRRATCSVRLEDEEARARLDATEAEAAARRRERDAGPLVAGRDDVRRTEDAVAVSEHALRDARADLDNLVRSKAAADAINAARNRLKDARDRLQRDRDAWRAAQNRASLPIANRLELALTAARADVWTAEAVLEKTRIRAPMKGTVLQVNAKVGELSSPQSELPLVLLGDISALGIKVDLEERDVAKIKTGQKVFVRSKPIRVRISTARSRSSPPRSGRRA